MFPYNYGLQKNVYVYGIFMTSAMYTNEAVK